MSTAKLKPLVIQIKTRWSSADRLAWLLLHRRDLDVFIRRRTPMQLRNMPLAQAREELQAVRDAWEALTGRNQDMTDEYIASMGARDIKSRLGWYCSDEARVTGMPWLVDAIKDALLFVSGAP